MSYSLGERIPFTKKFTIAGVDTDPDVVRFFLREHLDGTELEWTYDAVAVEGTHYPLGMNPIVRDSAGDYSLAWDARKTERITGAWLGTGTVYDTTETTAFVRHSAVEALDNP